MRASGPGGPAAAGEHLRAVSARALASLSLHPRRQRDRPRAFRRTLEIEPDYPKATRRADARAHPCGLVRLDGQAAGLAEALALGQRAVQLDPTDPTTQYALGTTLNHLGRAPDSLARLRECVHLNPSHAAGHAMMAFCYNYLDCPEKAFPHVNVALRLSPHDPRRFLWLPALAGAHYLSGDYRAALAAAQEALAADPTYLVITRGWSRAWASSAASPRLPRCFPFCASSTRTSRRPERKWRGSLRSIRRRAPPGLAAKGRVPLAPPERRVRARTGPCAPTPATPKRSVAVGLAGCHVRTRDPRS